MILSVLVFGIVSVSALLTNSVLTFYKGKEGTMKRLILTVCVSLVVLFCGVDAMANFYENFDSYADGNLDAVSGGTWVQAGGAPNYPLKVKTLGASKVASQYPVNDYRGADFLHYAPASNIGMPNGGADYTVAVDIDIDGNSYGGITDDGSFGVVGRLQDNSTYVYAYILVDLPSNGANTADLWIQRNGASVWWTGGVSVSYLNNNLGHIAMTMTGENVHVEANWGTSYSKTDDFTVSGNLLNAGPAGINARDYHGNNYYVMGNFDNFSVVPEPATLSLVLGGLAGLLRRK